MTKENESIRPVKTTVRLPTTEERFCSGENVDYFELTKSLGRRLTVPKRATCKGYVRGLAKNIISHGRVHVPILIIKNNEQYIVKDGVYRILALEQIMEKHPDMTISVQAKLQINK